MHSHLRLRFASALALTMLAACVAFEALAARAYPGGTYCDPAAETYRFWGNFLCDLTQPTTPSGAPNVASAPLARAAFTAVAAALAPFWWLLGQLLPARTRRAVHVAGLLSALATIAIAWLPSRSAPKLHATVVFFATVPALVAAVVATRGLIASARERSSRTCATIAALGAASLILGLADALGYAYGVATQTACIPWLPALQKLAAISVVSWICTVAYVSARGA